MKELKLPGLRGARTKAKLTQAELARKAGLTAQTVCNLENGFSTRWGTIRKLSDALGVSADILEQEAQP